MLVFFQYSADILAEESINADAGIIALLIESLRAFGLGENEFKLRLGDRTLWVLFLQSRGVEEQFVIPVLSVFDKIEKVSPEALAEMAQKALEGSAADASALVADARGFIKARTLDEIRACFPTQTELAEKIDARLGDWRTLLSMLESLGVREYISPDLGIVRGLAYYTGFVFEAFQTVGTERALAGGGRYDEMIGKFSGQNVSACGFSIGFERIVTILKDHMQGSYKLPEGSTAYLVGGKVPTARKAEVLAQAAQVRTTGVVATVLPMSKNIKHQIELLEAEGFTKFEKIYE